MSFLVQHHTVVFESKAIYVSLEHKLEEDTDIKTLDR